MLIPRCKCSKSSNVWLPGAGFVIEGLREAPYSCPSLRQHGSIHCPFIIQNMSVLRLDVKLLSFTPPTKAMFVNR